ncbi:MAG: hypothetical protein ACREV6_04135 [Clostridium sp.]|uniref:hypothetical protein n=1 Tax=Clostridium sp. TaxID=1506 RepID=UPI003D6D2552
MKKIIYMLMIIISLVAFAGCKKTTSKVETKDTKQTQPVKKETKTTDVAVKDEKAVKSEDGVVQKNKLDAEKIVTTNFTKTDAQFDFKLKTTKKFLGNYDKICTFLDSRYIDNSAPVGFVKARTQSQLKFTQEIKDYEKRYQYIKKVKYGLFFNDDSKDKVTFEELNLTLCDDNKDGKIELNDKSKDILKTVYPKVNLVDAQNKINETLVSQKSNKNPNVQLETSDKYCKIHLSWFKYKENPVEVTIQIQQFEDYPRS